MHVIDRLRRPVDRAARALGRGRQRLGASPVIRRAARHRVGAWVVAAAVAVGVQHTVADARAERRAWGRTVGVVVVVDAVAPGAGVGTGSLRLEALPLRTVPVGALRALPRGVRATVGLSPGQVVTAAMVDRGGRGPEASLIPPGRVAVAVATGSVRPQLSRGDHVDVLADVTLARGATVLTVRSASVTLAVRPREATATAEASVAGPVALVLLR